ncbi:metal ABC transporter substrate-binding protein [Georgenia sp. H159]|uniref:metal ABC transporter substrate-binding protein n=1 Tax=Georgenia sp. H159 TaxID=3076115 RepID=UPI002D7846CD|nr:metal ABC transporter substrate-binding protein [Georgenia sp. H159]
MSRSRALPALVVAALALGGCAAFQADDGDDGATAGGDGTAPTVLTSFYPLQYVTEEIGGDRLTVSSLTPPGVDPHTVELAPRTVADMAEAGLVVYLAGFQTAVDEAVDVTGVPAFDAAEHTELLTTGQTGHDHDDEHAGDEHADETATGSEPVDAHFWLDPARLAEVAQALADELADLDPDGAAAYRANADTLVAELGALDDELDAGLASCERDTIVVAHEAYGYLTADHGLRQEGLSGIDPDSEPSPARLAEIADVVAEHDVDTIFVESLLSPAVSEALAQDLGLRTAVLDPLENQQDEGADYLDVMRANLGALQTALGCTA